MVLDDVINGNVSLDSTSFFTGTQTLVNQLGNLQTNVSNIISNFTTNMQTSVNNMVTDCNTAMGHIEVLGDGTTTNGSFSLSYTNPAVVATTPSPLPSAFGSVLGTPSTSNTLSSVLYTIVSGIKSAMTTMQTAISTLQTNSATLTAGIGTAKDQVATYNNLIIGIDGMLNNYMGFVVPYMGYLKIALLVFFGAAIGLAVLAIIGAILTGCFDKVGCRHLMYVSCVFMLIICILGFLISCVFSFLLPVYYLGCNTASAGLSSQSNLVSLAATLNIDPSYTNSLACCLSGGDGQLLNTLGSTATTVNGYIADIQNTMANAVYYSTFDTTPLSNALANITTTIDNFVSAALNDIYYESNTLNFFKAVANRTQYSTACSGNAAFNADSLVPSTNSLSTGTVPCASGTSVPTCTSVTACPAGCLDYSSLMTNYANSATFQTAWTTRYAGACGTAVGADMATMYNNWYTPRTSTVNGITSVRNRYNAGVKTDVNQMITDFTPLRAGFTTCVNSLNATLYHIIDPNYGLIAGLNCLTLGQDLVIASDTVCTTLFNSIYFLFITMGTTSFAFLFGMCCIVCTGVRNFKQHNLTSARKVMDQDSSFNLPHKEHGHNSFYPPPVEHYGTQQSMAYGGYPAPTLPPIRREYQR